MCEDASFESTDGYGKFESPAAVGSKMLLELRPNVLCSQTYQRSPLSRAI